MKDKLTDLFHERFSGHELEVPPGTWEAISAQVTAASGAGLQGALKDKFTGHEMNVDPGVWQNISSQLGHGAAAGTAAGTGSGWLAAGVGALVLGGGLLYWTLSSSSDTTPAHQQVAQVQQQAITPSAVTTNATPSTAAPAEEQHTAQAAVPNISAPAARPSSEPNSSVPDRSEQPVRHTEPSSPSDNSAMHPPVPAPTVLGQRTVAEVMQQAVAENATKPEPAKPEAVPPPSINDLPIQPEPETASEAQPEAQPPVVEDASEPKLFIPNVFSPNGDNINDKLLVTCDRCGAVEVRIISAKTNELVFKAKDLDHQWDGTMANGQPAEDGYYFYAIEVTGSDGRVRSKGEVVRLFHH